MIEYIRYRIPADAAEEFAAAYRRATPVLKASPHCRAVEVTRCVEEPDRWVIRITWDSVEGHLAGFRNSADFPVFLQHIRAYIPHIEEMQHYETVEPVPPPSLYDWAGGHEVLTRWLTTFYDAVMDDELLRDLFTPMPAGHVERVALWLGEVLGGPGLYTTNHGGHGGMIRHHRNKHITEKQRRRWQQLLMTAADEVGLPADPEFRASLVAYVEWGTRLAVIFSGEDAPPDPSEAVPHWDWIRPPWQPTA